MLSPAVDFAALNASLAARGRELLREWFPKGKATGVRFEVGNLQGESGHSLSVDIPTGRWLDRAAEHLKGGDYVSLYAAIHGISQLEAARRLSPPTGEPQDRIELIPENDWPPASKKLGAASSRFRYRNAAGETTHVICRYELAADPSIGQEAGKTFQQWRKIDRQWVPKSLPKPHALYRLNELLAASAHEVWIFEGEKKADAAAELIAQQSLEAVATSWSGGASNAKHADWSALRARRCLLWPDNDAAGRAAMIEAGRRLKGLGATVTVLSYPPDSKPAKWDIVDAIKSGWQWADVGEFIEQYRAEFAAAPVVVPIRPESAPPGDVPRGTQPPPPQSQRQVWLDWGLDQNKQGNPYENTENVCRILAALSREANAFGNIWYDEFAVRIMTMSADRPRSWEDSDTIALQCFCQASIEMKGLRKHIVHDAVIRHARRTTRNPVREWLTGLTWDQVPRLPQLLHRGWGAQFNPYTQAVGRCFIVGAVARIMQPGCQLDMLPVFEGGQGIGKTSALRALATLPWHDEPSYHLGDRDFYLCMAGKWFLELSELSQLKGIALEIAKSVITRREDSYRAPYERMPSTHPRMCVFAATTNSEEWNADDTGARRFLPIACGTIDVEYITENREQIFAEALQRYLAGESWWDVPLSDARAEQLARRPDDIWTDAIALYIEKRDEVSLREVLVYALELESARDQSMSAKLRAGGILRDLGWIRTKLRIKHRVLTVWRRDGPVQRALASTKDD